VCAPAAPRHGRGPSAALTSARLLRENLEEHLQVIGDRGPRVPRALRADELQIALHQRMPERDRDKLRSIDRTKRGTNVIAQLRLTSFAGARSLMLARIESMTSGGTSSKPCSSRA
jgi:hypothetical protein